ncbi:DUF5677 domain-containing protein [Planctomycetota bacterium]
MSFRHDDRSAECYSQYQVEFDLVQEALLLVQEPLDESRALAVPRRDGIDDTVLLVAAPLYVKLWRLGAAVTRLALHLHAHEAESFVRTMFETALALHFLLRRQVRPRTNGAVLQHNQRPFSSRFRARMYVAHLIFQKNKLAATYARTPGFKRALPAAAIERARLDAEAAAKELGPFWAPRVKRHLTGLNTRDLAESLGMLSTYLTLYKWSNAVVHPGDMERFIVEVDGAPRLDLSPTTDDTARVVFATANLLVLGAQATAKRLGFPDLRRCEALVAQLKARSRERREGN